MDNSSAIQPDVVVIGGGAAGIFAAYRAAALGARVTVLERNRRIGTKILISGGGKCNITHDCPVDDLVGAFRAPEGRFLRPAFYRLPPHAVVDMLRAEGLATAARPDGRVFPSAGTARDVVAVMEHWLRGPGVTLRLGTRVEGIDAPEGHVTGVHLAGETVATARVVLATGGASYPATGATGDGYRFAADLGHAIVPIRAALAPIETTPRPDASRAGVALRDCLLRARTDSGEIARRRGDVLFTHRGVSGPAVLEISREVAEAADAGAVRLEVDLRPDDPFERLHTALAGYLADHPRRRVLGFVESMTPHRLAPDILADAGIPPDRACAHLRRDLRSRLVGTLKAWPLGVVDCVPLERGEVVAGGVSLDEVDPQTLRSRIVGGLYLCGEVLDVAGPVGGYNLQAAFSTGWVAGETAVRDASAG